MAVGLTIDEQVELDQFDWKETLQELKEQRKIGFRFQRITLSQKIEWKSQK